MSSRRNSPTSASVLKKELANALREGTRDISVSKLCKRAGIARATFYLHFKSIDDVIAAIVDDIFDYLEASVGELPDGADPVDQMTAQMQATFEYREVLLALFEMGKLDEVTRRARVATKEFLLKSYPDLREHNGSERFEDTLSFLVGGVAMLMETWLRSTKNPRKEDRLVIQMTEMTQALLSYGVGREVD
jgi:AcrR family transcriptional regulator